MSTTPDPIKDSKSPAPGGPNTLSEKEKNLIATIVTHCLKSGPLEIDSKKLVKYGEFNTMKTAQNTWGKLKAKIAAMNDDGDVEGKDGADTPKTPKTPKAAAGGATPASKKRGKKTDDDEEGGDGGASPKKKTRKSPAKKGGKKAGTAVEDADDDVKVEAAEEDDD
ncbi:hypothetical protein BDY17DRAFT_309931 [Neohortaea acidophila]|uniref:Uncharacterized protein n=1 Tax=Neohortaea acidophila TaxID=245834 RepID=A0A6A6PXD3_9PEZI|nr:uncharacterized protein BDY17DRAFT_309931 [Neohortaea acidophila]KAF2484770.1 hypothetical protein BDY17DRAFT_309931 [Neohortaea acidophila]